MLNVEIIGKTDKEEGEEQFDAKKWFDYTICLGVSTLPGRVITRTFGVEMLRLQSTIQGPYTVWKSLEVRGISFQCY